MLETDTARREALVNQLLLPIEHESWRFYRLVG
jgi:hypothetical protein